MFLSKCLIVSRRPLNPYEIHRRIWSFFPNQPSASRDFLFRMEGKTPSGQAILLQSGQEPIPGNNKILLLETKQIPYSFTEGQSLRFFLTANPTKRIRDHRGKKGNQGRCRVPLIDEDEIRDWLARKFDQSAQLHEVVLAGKNTVYFRKKNHPGKIVTVSYSGMLSVQDSKLFLNLVEEGIGPAKAFGCGLLSLARV